MMCYTGSGAVLVGIRRVAERAAVRAVERALDGVVPARLALDRAPIEHGAPRLRAGRVADAHVQALEVARVQVVRAFIPRRVIRKYINGQLLDLFQIILLFIITLWRVIQRLELDEGLAAHVPVLGVISAQSHQRKDVAFWEDVLVLRESNTSLHGVDVLRVVQLSMR